MFVRGVLRFEGVCYAPEEALAPAVSAATSVAAADLPTTEFRAEDRGVSYRHRSL